jgi:16S rRNA processing protein RimM
MKRREQSNSPQSNSETGSPTPGEPVFIAVGYLRRAHGIHGEMIMDVLTDFPDRLRPRRTVYLGEAHEPVKIESVRWHNKVMIVKLVGVETPEDIAPYRNQLLTVRVDELPPLAEGEYYHHQLLGLNVVLDSGEVVGVLEEILETGANDVYVVRKNDGGEVLFPAIDEVILKVDLQTGQIIARPQEWV